MKRFDQELNGFHWTDCEAPSQADLVTLSSEFDIPLSSLTACLDPESLPKCETLPEGTLVIMRVYDPHATDASGSIQEISTKLAFLIQENLILTIHRSELAFVSDKKNKCVFEKPMTIREFLKFLISQSILSYDNPLIEMELQAARIEERVYTLKKTHILRDGYHLKRRASALKKIFRFTNDSLNKLGAHQELVWADFQDIRDLMDRFTFYTDDVLENISGLLNLHISLLSQMTNEASYKTNEIMRVLTVFSIFFLPLNFIAGIYGMNFEHMPELKTEHGYFYALLAMAAIALGIFIWSYRKGWLAPPERPEGRLDQKFDK